MDMLLPPEADRSPLLLSMLAIVCGCANAAVVPDSKSAPNRARQEDESVKPPTTTSAPSSTPRDYYPRRPASLVVTEQPPVMVKRTQRLRVTLLVVGIPETDLGSMVVFMRMHDGTKDCDVSHLMCGPRIVDVTDPTSVSFWPIELHANAFILLRRTPIQKSTAMVESVARSTPFRVVKPYAITYARGATEKKSAPNYRTFAACTTNALF